MFIFITPRIIKNPGDMDGVTTLKADALEKVMPEAKQLLVNPTDKNHVMSLIDQGFEQMQKKNHPAAKEFFDNALSLDPQNPYARFNLATINEREGNPRQAITYYQMILDHDSAQTSATGLLIPGTGDSGIIQTTKENIERLHKTVPPLIESKTH
jgi:tetratricopeptide (TPR) repeat protein